MTMKITLCLVLLVVLIISLRIYMVSTPLLSHTFVTKEINSYKLQVDSNKRHFSLNGTRVFLSGINQAWVEYCHDFGNDQYNYRRNAYERTIRMLKQAGGNSISEKKYIDGIWVHCEGETSPSFDGNGYVTGMDRKNTFISDLQNYIKYAAYHDILVFITLWSAAIKEDIHYRIDGLVRDMGKLESYIDNALIPLVNALKDEPGLGGWDVINEFEGQLKLDVADKDPCFDTRFLKYSGASWVEQLYTAKEWLRFINHQVDAIRRTDPLAQVTAGAWAPYDVSDHLSTNNLYSDECLLAAGGKPLGTLTFYSMHSYDWNGKYDDIMPFKHNASDYQLDKPLVIAEFNQRRGGGMTSAEQYTHLYNHGYAGAWSWSYTDESWSVMSSGMKSIMNFSDHLKGGLVDFNVNNSERRIISV